MNIEGKICYGEVQFFFITPDELSKPVALVWTFSAPNEDLFEDSHGVVYSVTKLVEEEGLKVVNVESILSVIAMVPHNYVLEDGKPRFFVWERIGLEVTSLGGALERISNEAQGTDNDRNNEEIDT
jgi:hypothetical protein